MRETSRLRVTHIITGLEVGGAERLLAHLLSATQDAALLHDVVALGRDGPVGDELRGLGVQVQVLHAERAADVPAALWRLVRYLRLRRPDVVHTWMVHSNALGGLAARLARRRTVWSLHHSDLDPQGVRRSTLAIERANGVLSRLLADAVVTTSASAASLHRRGGYRPDRLVVIPNAVADAELVCGEGLRQQLDVPDSHLLIGRIGRFSPQKDYPTLLSALAALAADGPPFHLVLVGRGVDAGNHDLVSRVTSAGLEGRCSLLGERADAARLVASLDLVVSSSSFGETTPLVLLEALAAATPVVTTDVGDCAELIGPGGLVVPPRDSAALAQALRTVLAMTARERQVLGLAGRRHVAGRGGTAAMAREYEAIYRAVSSRR